MLKVVINTSTRAPFGLSAEAARLYIEACGLPLSAALLFAASMHPRRDDTRLVAIVEALGIRGASADGARIVVVALPLPLPNGWRIKASRGDGCYERVHERARVWDEIGLLLVAADADDGGLEACDARFLS